MGRFSQMFCQGLRGVVPVAISFDETEIALPNVPAHAPEDSLLMRADVSVLVVRMRRPVLPSLRMHMAHDALGAVLLKDASVANCLAQERVADSEEAEMLEPLLGNYGRRFFGLAPFFAAGYSIYY